MCQECASWVGNDIDWDALPWGQVVIPQKVLPTSIFRTKQLDLILGRALTCRWVLSIQRVCEVKSGPFAAPLSGFGDAPRHVAQGTRVGLGI